MSLDLDNLLESMAREGRVDSSGGFTIDLAAAQLKLAKFTLPDSRGYILKMVQAAVAGNASELHLDSHDRAVEVRILGLELEQDGLELLLYRLAESGKALPRASYHLAVGIRAALGLESSEISICSCDGKAEKRILWARNSIKHEVQESERPPETVLRFTRTRWRFFKESLKTLTHRDFMGMVRGERSGYDEEQRLVNDICCLAPLKITINGRQVPRLAQLPNPSLRPYPKSAGYPHLREHLYASALDWSPEVGRSDLAGVSRGFLAPEFASNPQVQGSSSNSGWRLCSQDPALPSWQKFEYDQVIGIHPKFPESQIMVILDGVLIHRRCTEGPGLTAMITGQGLTTDLTGFKLVENDAFVARCRALELTAEHLINECSSKAKSPPLAPVQQ